VYCDFYDMTKVGYCILLIKANRMHYFSTLFGKEIYMILTDLLSIIRSLNTVFTAMVICHISYVDCLLARSGWNSSNPSNSIKSVKFGQNEIL